jgi:polyisoprenoid-binding protein YceI
MGGFTALAVKLVRCRCHTRPELTLTHYPENLMSTGKMIFAAILAIAAVPATAAADTYKLDPEHTYPSLEFSHLGISVWRGKFDKTSGKVTLDRAARTGTVDVVIDTASINFGLDSMHEHAISEDWFDVKKFPTATYKGKLKFTGDTPKAVDGDFSFRGMTKPLKLTINSFKCIPHPITRNEVCGADAEGELNWAEWGMKHSEYGKGEAGKVKLRIQIEGQKE